MKGKSASGKPQGAKQGPLPPQTRAGSDPSAGPKGFATVIKAFATDPDVTPPGTGKGFGSHALKVNGKIFAMMSSKGQLVVKLPNARTDELVAAGHAQYFDAGRGKPMKEWAAITAGERLWPRLAKEARDFVARAR